MGVRALAAHVHVAVHGSVASSGRYVLHGICILIPGPAPEAGLAQNRTQAPSLHDGPQRRHVVPWLSFSPREAPTPSAMLPIPVAARSCSASSSLGLGAWQCNPAASPSLVPSAYQSTCSCMMVYIMKHAVDLLESGPPLPASHGPESVKGHARHTQLCAPQLMSSSALS